MALTIKFNVIVMVGFAIEHKTNCLRFKALLPRVSSSALQAGKGKRMTLGDIRRTDVKRFPLLQKGRMPVNKLRFVLQAT